MPKPYSLVIHLPDGEPDGIRRLTKHGWSGVGLVVPRSKLSEAIVRREEFGRPGVYVLSGKGDDDELPRVYVGEGNPVVDRLKTHQSGTASKDFWDRCIFFTANDESLSKTHIQFLEARLHARAVAGKRCLLENVQTPKEPALNEVDHADSENFLEQMLTIFPLVELTAFRDPATNQAGPSAGDGKPDAAADVFTLQGKGVEATGRVTNEGFIVHAGSRVVPEQKVANSCDPKILKLRAELLAAGVVQQEAPPDNGLCFVSAYEFTSPSLAACFVLGNTSNGRYLWRDGKGLNLNEREAAAAAAVTPSPGA